MPRVSVIMGVYNCKDIDALYRSVFSIINQTFKDWEFIVCNDGSVDETLSVLKDIEKLDTRIKILTYEGNRGLAFALNYCIKLSKGKYLARMDDDDVARNDRLEKQINFLEEHKEYAFVGSIANVFNKDGYWGILKMPEYPSKNDLLWNIPFIHPSMIFRKEVFNLVNGYSTDTVNRRCEDYTLVMDLYSKGLKGYNFQEPLIDYFIENGNKKYRPMIDRFYEAIVRFRGYRKNRMFFIGILFVAKPIVLGLIPQCIFRIIKRFQYSNKLF